MAVPPTGPELALEGVRLLSSMLYVLVGAMILRRDVDPDARLAQYGFAVWWFGIAMIGFIAMPFSLGANLAESGLTAVRVFIYLVFPALFLAIGGLVYYLLFIYTGRHRLWAPVGLYYMALLVALVYLFEGGGPFIGVDDEGELAVEYAREVPRWVSLLFSLGLVLPPLGAAVAFFLLFFTLKEPLRRYRIALVSVGIIVWFGYSLFNTMLRFVTGTTEQSLIGQAIGQALGLLAATLVILAYAPPRRWSARLAMPKEVSA